MQPFTKTLKSGSHLFHEKDHSRELYIIQDGTVLIYRKVGTREVVLARLEKGSVFGEMALIDGKPRSASARAVSDCKLIMIDADTFHDKIRGVPPWFMSIIRTTSEKIRKANQRLQNSTAENLESKLIIAFWYFFKRDAETDSESGQKALDLLKVKKQVIQLMCITHQRLVWVLGFLQKKGMVDLQGNRILLKDAVAFEEYCSFLRGVIRKAYDKRPSSMDALKAFITAIAEKNPASLDSPETHFDLNSEACWQTFKTAGLEESWKENTQAFRDIGLLNTRKAEEPAKEDNPCSGTAYTIDTITLKRWLLYFRYSEMIPSL
jgi:CRP/FNR family transcriptional regulator, cyclic AMP receptor protein